MGASLLKNLDRYLTFYFLELKSFPSSQDFFNFYKNKTTIPIFFEKNKNFQIKIKFSNPTILTTAANPRTSVQSRLNDKSLGRLVNTCIDDWRRCFHANKQSFQRQSEARVQIIETFLQVRDTTLISSRFATSLKQKQRQTTSRINLGMIVFCNLIFMAFWSARAVSVSSGYCGFYIFSYFRAEKAVMSVNDCSKKPIL